MMFLLLLSLSLSHQGRAWKEETKEKKVGLKVLTRIVTSLFYHAHLIREAGVYYTVLQTVMFTCTDLQHVNVPRLFLAKPRTTLSCHPRGLCNHQQRPRQSIVSSTSYSRRVLLLTKHYLRLMPSLPSSLNAAPNARLSGCSPQQRTSQHAPGAGLVDLASLVPPHSALLSHKRALVWFH